MKAEAYILQTITLRNQIHVFHWQTESFAEHKALDEFYNEIVEQIDNFVETYQGRYGRVKLGTNNTSLVNYKKGAAKQQLEKFVTASEGMKKTLGDKPSDLQNILDENLFQFLLF